MGKEKLFYIVLLTVIACWAAISLFSVWQGEPYGKTIHMDCLFDKKTEQEKWAAQTVLAYIQSERLLILPCTGKYNVLMRAILMSDVPELAKAPSAFIKTNAEAQVLAEYAAKNYHDPAGLSGR